MRDIIILMTTYYTDGSASPNPGPGGFAVIRDLQPYIWGQKMAIPPIFAWRVKL